MLNSPKLMLMVIIQKRMDFAELSMAQTSRNLKILSGTGCGMLATLTVSRHAMTPLAAKDIKWMKMEVAQPSLCKQSLLECSQMI